MRFMKTVFGTRRLGFIKIYIFALVPYVTPEKAVALRHVFATL